MSANLELVATDDLFRELAKRCVVVVIIRPAAKKGEMLELRANWPKEPRPLAADMLRGIAKYVQTGESMPKEIGGVE